MAGRAVTRPRPPPPPLQVRMWQSLGFTAQFVVGLSQPGNNFLQARLVPQALVTLGPS